MSNKLRHIIREEIEKHLLSEAVSRGVLYHFTSEEGFSVNVKNHGFKFHQMEHQYDEDPSISKYSSALSTTRLYNLRWGIIRFNLNGDYISSKYPIKPVHYYNRQDDAEYRNKKGFSRDGLPLNQYEETILSKQKNHVMALDNKIVFSVDILSDEEDFISKYSIQLKELSALGIPYNFVNSFEPFKGVDKVSVSEVKQNVNELLRLRSEDDVINFLQGKNNIKEILSDVRVIMMVCSKAYLRVLREMVKLNIDLGINDYDDSESKNMWTDRVHKAQVNLDDYLALKAAGDNTDVLSILLTSDKLPIKIKYNIVVNYKLVNFYDMLYNSNLEAEDKLKLSTLANNYNIFEKYFDESEDKQFSCFWVKARNLDNRFAEKCLSSDISNNLKYNISTKYGIGNAEQYYEEPKASNYDEDLPF